MSSKVVSLPLELIQPHLKLAFRFRYEVDSLSDSIRETADESTPNGQLNPGRVVKAEGKEGYCVYIGVRRFLALKTLHERTKDARFGVFNAYVDEGLSELQMFLKAKAENEEEKGERQPLSLLEQVRGIRMIRESVDPSKASPAIKQLLVLADKWEEKRLQKLNEAEGAAGSRFTERQLEGLARVNGTEAEFYTTAATMVAFRVNEAEDAEKKRDAAFSLTWLKRVFPEIKEEKKEETNNETATKTEDNKPEVHEKDVLLAPCPRCGGGNMVRVKGEVEITHVDPDPDGEALTVVADTVSKAKLPCSHCGGEIFMFVRHVEGKYLLAASTSGTFRDPKEETEVLDLRFDRKENAWQRIEGDKVGGLVVLAPQQRK